MSAQVYGQRVGLVLSGGGAKGLAHIGVIKALEENEIPIDYIAGTSMGAIIGGLYAAGYSYEEMMELVSSDDFSRWSSGEIDEKYIYYLKKKENNAAQFSIKFTKKGTETLTKLPTNLIPTNPMDFAFMQIFSAPAAIAGYDFDKLFVPFRCMGSDIYNNKSVVFKKGQLSDAIRASMTLPFYFKPITIDSVLYFDGGIYDNFPYQVLIDDFHPDILIGSKTASNTSKPDEDNVLLQIENMIAGITDYSLPDSNGIMVETKFKDIGLLDFNRYDSIIERGYQSALQQIDEIKSKVKRSVSREYRNQLRKTFKNSLPELNFQHISVNGLDSNQARFIKQSITNENGYFHVEQFKQKYFELIADDRIESIYPTAVYNEKTKMFELVLKVKKQSPFITQIGGNISSSSLNTGFVGFEWNKLGMIGNTVSANFYYGKFYSSGQIKYVMDFPSFIPFRTTFRAAYNQWDYFSGSNSPFFEDYKPAYLIQKEAHFGFIVSFPAGINRVVKIGTSISQSWDEYYQSDSFTKNDTADITELHLNNLGFSIERNTLNHKQYPTRGKLRQFGAQYVYGDEVHRPGSTSVDENTYNRGQDWYHIRLKNDTYHRIFKNVNMGVHLEGVYSNMKFLRNYTSTMLNAPAFQPFPHSKILFLENYRAHAYIAAGLKPVIQSNSWLHTRVEGYFFVPYKKILQNEQQQAYYGEKFKNFYLMLSSAVVAHTPFGPASISLNYYDRENKKWFVVFNFGYIMFNKKGSEY